jgi:hypothetical protein
LGAAVYLGWACNIDPQRPGPHDCVETPGHCAFNEYCDSDTRRCVLTCTALPPRKCPEGSSCDYASGKCRPPCLAGKQPTEVSCENGVDDDCNGLSDCADPVCEGRACGNACGCDGGLRVELDCGNLLDDDFDGKIDCSDEDCLAFVCRSSRGPCDVEVRCDGQRAACPAPRYSPDASCGAGCACDAGSSIEARCDDRLDNDSDGKADCADTSDCPAGSPCQRGDGGAGTCMAGGCQ